VYSPRLAQQRDLGKAATLTDAQVEPPPDLFFLDKLVKTGKTGLICLVHRWLDSKAELCVFGREKQRRSRVTT
jgi:hypothetical protein